MSELGKSKILLVDDDKHLLLTLTDYLSFKGYDVYAARSAESALETLESVTPDLIILDIGMPGMGGMGFIKQQQRFPERDKVPILILSAKVIMEDFFAEMDVDGFLAKPCTEEDLLRTIKETLSRHSASLLQEEQRDPRILLVEDDPVVAEEIRSAFRVAPRKMDITLATSAAEAIEKTVTMKPDLLVTNEVLRGMNGSDMARLVRQMPGAHSVPILIYKKSLNAEGLWVFGHRILGEGTTYVDATNSLSLLDAVSHLLDSTEHSQNNDAAMDTQNEGEDTPG